jgi:hypothetical protein
VDISFISEQLELELRAGLSLGMLLVLDALSGS